MFHVKQKRVAFRCSAGACLLCRLPTLPLVCFSAPIPPTPFPRGEGGDFCFILPGAGAPGTPATPATKPGRHWLFLPRQCFLPPSPRPPSRREGGDFLFYFAGGWRPRHPLRLSPDGIGFFCRVSAFLPPSPRPPSPAGKGEIFGFLMQGAPPLASPGLSPGGAGSVGGLAPPAPLLQKLRSTDIPSGRNHLNITGSTLVNAYL